MLDKARDNQHPVKLICKPECWQRIRREGAKLDVDPCFDNLTGTRTFQNLPVELVRRLPLPLKGDWAVEFNA